MSTSRMAVMPCGFRDVCLMYKALYKFICVLYFTFTGIEHDATSPNPTATATTTTTTTTTATTTTTTTTTNTTSF